MQSAIRGRNMPCVSEPPDRVESANPSTPEPADPDEIDVDTTEALGTESATGAAAAPNVLAQQVIPEVDVLPYQPPLEVLPLQGTVLPLESPPPDPLDQPPASETAAESGAQSAGYADPFNAPRPLVTDEQLVDTDSALQADTSRLGFSTPYTSVYAMTVQEPPLPLDQPPVSGIVHELGIKPPSTLRSVAAQQVPSTGEGALVGKIEGKVETPPEYKAPSSANDPSGLVGKVSGLFAAPNAHRQQVVPVVVHAYDPVSEKHMPPGTDHSSLLGDAGPTAATRKWPNSPATDPSALVGKIETPTGKIETPVPQSKRAGIPVPVAKRRNYLPTGLLAVALLVGLVVIGLGVMNGGFLFNQATDQPTFVAVSSATPSTVPATVPPSLASESPLITTAPPSPTSSQPIATLKPTPTSQPTPTTQPTATTQPTTAPTPKPTPTPPKVTPTPPKPTTPPPIVAFKVTPQQVSTTCKDLGSFDISLNNSGSNVAVDWSIKFLDSAWGSAKPQSGTLDAGAVSTVTITPAALCPLDKVQDFVLEIAYGGDSPETVIYQVSP
jgi:hypothetical protein